MDIPTLCRLIDVPEQISAQIRKLIAGSGGFPPGGGLSDIEEPARWTPWLEDFRGRFAPDPDGIKMLSFQLHLACETFTRFQDLGVPQGIFLETMGFFTRMLRDHHQKGGRYQYVWDWWALRQLTLKEFRIGALEYEMTEKGPEKVIQIHIPSDTIFDRAHLRASYLGAKDFFTQFFPDFAQAPFRCQSWLLAPSLTPLLPPRSRIRDFQKSFTLVELEKESPAFLDWIYGRRDIPPGELPETTSLQRAVKHHVLRGGGIEWAHGILVADPFLG